MVAIVESLRRAELQRVQYRAMASGTSSPSSAAISAYGGAPGSPGDWFQESSAAARLYAMASHGHAYAAIRPIAVRVADLTMRVGMKKSSGSERMKRIVEKSYAGDEELASQDWEHSWLLKQFAPPFVKQASKNVDIVEQHPFLDAVATPNEFQTGWALMYSTAYSLEACGEAIWLLDWSEKERTLGIYYMPRTWVHPIPEGSNPFGSYRLILPDRAADDLPPIPGKYVCHFMKPNPANPATSHCATSAQALALSTDDEIQKAQFHLTRNMSRPGMLVILGDMDPDPVSGKQSRPELTPEQKMQIVSQVRLHYTTAARFGDPLILDRMVHDVKPYMPTPADIDYKDGSALTKDRIYQGYGTNPIVAGQIQNGNRAQSYVAHDSLNFLQVNPLATLMSETITSKVGALFDGDGEARTLIWLDAAKAKDPDLMNARFNAASKFKEVLTKGDVRRYLATGEYERTPKDDDDEPAEQAAGGAAAPQEGTDPSAKPGADPNAAAKNPGIQKPGEKKPTGKKPEQPKPGVLGKKDLLGYGEQDGDPYGAAKPLDVSVPYFMGLSVPETHVLASSIGKGFSFAAESAVVLAQDPSEIVAEAAPGSRLYLFRVSLPEGANASDCPGGKSLVSAGSFEVEAVSKRVGVDVWDVEVRYVLDQ